MKTTGTLRWWLLAGILLLAAWLRFDHIGYGLPHTFNSDEPHHINLAVSFGSVSLKPYSFKYPALWPTLLACCYGAWFAVWSGFGLLRSAADFAGLFAWDPTGFYLIGRVLSALFGLLGLAAVWKAEEQVRSRGAFPWAVLCLAAAPVMIESSHSAKPDMAMFAAACAAWYAALRVYRDGGRRWHWACGTALGLAMSAQYTALPAVLLLPLAHALGRKASPSPGRFLAEGVVAAAVGFFAGSPYILLDFPRFWAAMRDFSALAVIREKSAARIALDVHLNAWNFSGVGSAAGLAAVFGFVSLWRRDRRLALLLSAPVAAYTASLSTHPDGSWMRYLLACFPGLALLAGEGLSPVAGWGRPAAVLAGLLVLGPGTLACVRHNRDLSLPDTRTQATEWIEADVPVGAVLLMDYPHACPRLAMVKEQALELEARTKAEGSPRWRLYEAMAASHPGGGYRIYRIQRSASDLRSNPEHVRMSQAETAVLDVSAGLGPARAARVEYVVVSSHGATPERSPELRRFFDELERQGRLLREFAPAPGRVRGPRLKVYRLGPAERARK
ncbi:MAG: glycosyltransferase family 39 protein [Elusimicrobia bacterium]|nr:glycosyltransferase family 39 protein [Elusimicrobiota bacterium]